MGLSRSQINLIDELIEVAYPHWVDEPVPQLAEALNAVDSRQCPHGYSYACFARCGLLWVRNCGWVLLTREERLRGAWYGWGGDWDDVQEPWIKVRTRLRTERDVAAQILNVRGRRRRRVGARRARRFARKLRERAVAHNRNSR